MARLNYKGHIVDVDDPTLVDYYRGDGATDVVDESVQVEDTAAGQPVEAADAAAEPQQDAPADTAAATDTAEPAQGDSAPQPGQAADPASA